MPRLGAAPLTFCCWDSSPESVIKAHETQEACFRVVSQTELVNSLERWDDHDRRLRKDCQGKLGLGTRGPWGLLKTWIWFSRYPESFSWAVSFEPSALGTPDHCKMQMRAIQICCLRCTMRGSKAPAFKFPKPQTLRPTLPLQTL